MAARDAFSPVFAALKAILKKYEPKLVVHSNKVHDYILVSKVLDAKKRPVWFGATAVRKGYVSYHLMAVYMFPELLKGISPELKARMQGKSCFNFKEPDADRFSELARLTKASFERYRKEALV